MGCNWTLCCPSFRRKPESRIMPAFAGIQFWTPFCNAILYLTYRENGAYFESSSF